MDNKYLDAYLAAFSNLSYRPTHDTLSLDDFLKAGCKALRLSPDMDEAVIACKMIYLCLYDWERLEATFENDKKFFLDSLEDEGLYLHPLSEKEAKGTTWLTNATRGSIKYVDITSEDGFLTSINKKGHFPSLSGKYRLEYDPEHKNKMHIFDRDDNHIVTLLMDDECDIHLEDNKTPYIMLGDEYGYLNLYRKGKEKPNKKDRVAEIIWGITNDEAPYIGLSRLKVYKEDDELFALIAMSGFLLYERYMDEGIENPSEA